MKSLWHSYSERPHFINVDHRVFHVSRRPTLLRLETCAHRHPSSLALLFDYKNPPPVVATDRVTVQTSVPQRELRPPVLYFCYEKEP